MQNDFSIVDNTIINEMALTFAIFILGSLLITLIVVGMFNMFKFPKTIIKVLIPVVVLGYGYFWVHYFL